MCSNLYVTVGVFLVLVPQSHKLHWQLCNPPSSDRVRHPELLIMIKFDHTKILVATCITQFVVPSLALSTPCNCEARRCLFRRKFLFVLWFAQGKSSKSHGLGYYESRRMSVVLAHRAQTNQFNAPTIDFWLQAAQLVFERYRPMAPIITQNLYLQCFVHTYFKLGRL